jgi:hypothetical protein
MTMPDTVRKVDYFKIQTPNRPGQGARVLSMLKDANVNLLAFSGFPRKGSAQIDFIPENTASFLRAAKKAGLKVSQKKSGFLIQGKDRVGAVAEVMGKLAGNKINVTAVDAVSAGNGRWGAILWVKPKDVNRASRTLKS